MCSGIFPKIHLSQLIVLSFDVKQKPHTLNIQILLLRQKCMQFISGIKITFHSSHEDRDILRQRYPLIYNIIQEYSPPQW